MQTKSKKLQLPGKPENMRVIDYLRKNFPLEKHPDFYWTQYNNCWTLNGGEIETRVLEIFLGRDKKWYFTARRFHCGKIFPYDEVIIKDVLEMEAEEYEQQEKSKPKLVEIDGSYERKPKDVIAEAQRLSILSSPPSVLDISAYPKPVKKPELSQTRRVLSSLWSGVKTFFINLQSIIR